MSPHLLSLRFWWLLAHCVILRHCQIVGHGNKTGVVVGHKQSFQSVKLFHQLVTLTIKKFIHSKTYLFSRCFVERSYFLVLSEMQFRCPPDFRQQVFSVCAVHFPLA